MSKERFFATSHQEVQYWGLIDDKNQLLEIQFAKSETTNLVGTIYLGKVSNVVKGINAAFVDIGTGQDAYLALESHNRYLYANGKAPELQPCMGDELVVQVISEAIKTKAPKLSASFSLTGRYVVLTTDRNTIGVSNKIESSEEKHRLRQIAKAFSTEAFGFICRTNSAGVSTELLETEMAELVNQYNVLMKTYPYRTSKQVLFTQLQGPIRFLQSAYKSNIDAYLFDEPALYEQAVAYFKLVDPSQINKIQLIKESATEGVYRQLDIKTKLQKALSEKVWLKSGASILIQPTEALVVIDVNTDKYTGKKNMEETILKTNLEAAQEIIKQIRLRNLSGIIIIDFIDMQADENKNRLLDDLAALCKDERVPTKVIDMTALGLVEMTRKKINKSLYELSK